MKALYELWYRFGRPPWVGDARPELVDLVQTGRLPPGRAIDLGCGEGDNAIFLAAHGFDVTGVDFAPSAIRKARDKAEATGVHVDFLVDDLTRLRRVQGTFDLLVDYGALDDLGASARDRYVEQVVPLARPGGRFLLWSFEWEPRGWERVVQRLPFGAMALAPGEAARRFGGDFAIERIAGAQTPGQWPRGYAAYLMTRHK